MDLAPGMAVTPNVHLVEVLGEGGMGSVWIAEHSGLKTRVAVKFIATELIEQDPTLLDRFTREAALTAQIRSPHVVQTFDHGVMDDGRPYIVMELLDGEELANVLERDGRLSLEDTCTLLHQAAKGLSRAHKVGIVHRDIKPENLFLLEDEDGIFVKVLDFGIAKQTSLPKAENVTSTNMMIGTPEYMSPEQVLSSKTVDEKADMWSLAVVAYRCLTGGVPFTGETVGALAVSIASGLFAPPSQFRPELPAAVDQWFARALAIEPTERFQDAREMARAFTAAVLGPEAQLSGATMEITGAHTAVSDEASTGSSKAPPQAGSSATFTGTTRSTLSEAPKRRKLLAIALAVTGVLGAFAVTLAVMADEDPDGSGPAAETTEAPSPGPAAQGEAVSGDEDDPKPTAGADSAATAAPEPTGEPTAEAEAEATAEAEASAAPTATATAEPPEAPPAPKTPYVPPPPPPPEPKVKDRGF